VEELVEGTPDAVMAQTGTKKKKKKLRGGIVQSVPCTASILWSIVRTRLRSNNSVFSHQSSRKIPADTPSSETERNLARNIR
jgi:hypothetical protein